MQWLVSTELDVALLQIFQLNVFVDQDACLRFAQKIEATIEFGRLALLGAIRTALWMPMLSINTTDPHGGVRCFLGSNRLSRGLEAGHAVLSRFAYRLGWPVPHALSMR